MGIISQPDWRSADAFKALGKPNLLFGIAAGNMDSMINHSTADRKRRNDDAYTAGDVAGKRPDRAVTVYSQRAREAYRDVSLVIGGIEASLRRMAHYDYWSDNVRRSVLVDCKADILLYGNAERAIVDLAHGLTNGKEISDLRHLRGTAFLVSEPLPGYRVIDSTSVDEPGKVEPMLNPYEGMESEVCDSESEAAVEAAIQEAQPISGIASSRPDRDVIRLSSFETVKNDPVLYAHAARIMHKETISHNALALLQAHGDREVWFNPPPIPLSTPELDWVFEQSYQRRPHPTYGDAKIPAL